MKKLIALVLSLLMLATCSAELDGGWTITTLNEGETSVEVEYVEGQVAVLATQVVAGTNYCLLVRTQDAYRLVYVYEGFDGMTQIIKTCDLLTAPEGMMGGWALANDAIDPALFEKATGLLMGASYEAVYTLGTQVVAGTNYSVLCKITPIVPDAVSHYAVVTIYADLNGNATVTDVTDIVLTTAIGCE